MGLIHVDHLTLHAEEFELRGVQGDNEGSLFTVLDLYGLPYDCIDNVVSLTEALSDNFSFASKMLGRDRWKGWFVVGCLKKMT